MKKTLNQKRIQKLKPSSHSPRLPTTILWIALGLASASTACSREYEEETTLLERAEANFTAGEYDIAEQLYRQFLREHPRSPYVPIASQRLRVLERELEAVMGRQGTSTPLHVEQRLPPELQRVTPNSPKRER